jgi:hypothetical protein
MALSSSERQKRYIERLKAGAVSNNAPTAANAPAPVIDIPAIVSWWKAAKASQRELMCAEIGGYELADAMIDNDEFQECIDECVKITLRDYAGKYGYQPIGPVQQKGPAQ